ncbi:MULTISPECIES: hypothetical protein [unclassified Methylobacterium]|uniref:hypothetical protein n=1 Tax=unclassified Methylobacterium TaxID=2615210 RepID=UPI001FBAAE0D|nr:MULTISPECIES: hypothetical protein [unclassified Methylobacterium]MCJ2020847.1 hypothetical protein [Methylobacterium sp. E-065]
MTRRTRNPLSGGLLEIAVHLTSVRGRRIVEQAAFRRALSSAYYAVFHCLCQICCDGLRLWTASADEIELVYRNLEHNRARDVLASSKTRALHQDISVVADVFIALRRWREDADYSQPGRLGGEQKLLTRTETRTLIAAAEETVSLLDGLPADIRRKLAILLTTRSSRR